MLFALECARRALAFSACMPGHNLSRGQLDSWDERGAREVGKRDIAWNLGTGNTDRKSNHIPMTVKPSRHARTARLLAER